jgi:thioredoxin reductase (NADPH)
MSTLPQNQTITYLPVFQPELAFPHLTDEMISRLGQYGRKVSLPKQTSLFTPGEHDVDMFVVLEGSIDIYAYDEHKERRPIVCLHERQFSGELDLFSSQHTMVHASTSADCILLRVPRAQLQCLIRSEGDIANLLMQAMIWRRQGLLADTASAIVLVGQCDGAETVLLRRFLMRNGYPFRLIGPADHDKFFEEAASLLSMEQLPAVFLMNGRTLYRPSTAELADELGITQLPDADKVYDVAIVGAGPSGLAAAVYASSEGLSTLVVEGTAPGGQAGTSSKIENYLGFPTGVSGQELANRAHVQAQKFGAHMALSRDVVSIDRVDGFHHLTLAGGTSIRSRVVVVATGAKYRKLAIANYARFENQGIYYAATAMESNLCRNREVAVVGGGNSAGQAAIFLLGSTAHVHLIVRGASLASTMSQYLISRIEGSARITVHSHTDISQLEGNSSLESVCWINSQTHVQERRPIRGLFVMIGAEPNTGWLFGTLALDKKGFVVTGARGAFENSRYATSVPGIFAIGDVRSDSVKRVASAVGEGSVVISDVHRYLASNLAQSAQPNTN